VGTQGERLVTTDGQRLVSRRALARGVAWAAPSAIAVTAAPAMALSSFDCADRAIYDYNGGSATNVSPTGFTLGGVRVSTTFSTSGSGGSVVTGRHATLGSTVLQGAGTSTSTSGLGNTTSKNLLMNIRGDSAFSAVLTIGFSPSVRNVELYFRDLTNDGADGYRSVDSLTFSPAANEYANITNTSVGITSAPGALQRVSQGANRGGSSSYFDAKALFRGQISSIRVTYQNVHPQALNTTLSAIGLHRVTFCP
jgi:hypothetical protein